MSALSASAAVPVQSLGAAEAVYWSRSLRVILDDMLDALRAGGRITLITGECGVGKTTLLKLFLKQIPAERSVIHLHSCKFADGGLLPWILPALGAPDTVCSEPDAGLEFAISRLQTRAAPTVLLVDEAQSMNHAAFSQLAAILSGPSDAALTAFLFGQPQLAVKLRKGSGKAIAALPNRQHVIRPLNRQDVGGYLRIRSSARGCSPAIFTDEAIDLIHAASRGSPRLINRLCDGSLTLFEQKDVQLVDADLVREAIALSNGFDIFAPQVDVSKASPLRRRSNNLWPPSGEWKNIASAVKSGLVQSRKRCQSRAADIRFLEETPSGAALSTADLIVYETLEGTSYCNHPRLSEARSEEPPAVKPAVEAARNCGGGRGAARALPDGNSLILQRLLLLAAICLLTATIGLAVSPNIDSVHRDSGLGMREGPARHTSPTEAAGLAPTSSPLPLPWRESQPGKQLYDSWENWTSAWQPADPEKVRVKKPAQPKQRETLSEVLDRWKPFMPLEGRTQGDSAGDRMRRSPPRH